MEDLDPLLVLAPDDSSALQLRSSHIFGQTFPVGAQCTDEVGVVAQEVPGQRDGSIEVVRHQCSPFVQQPGGQLSHYSVSVADSRSPVTFAGVYFYPESVALLAAKFEELDAVLVPLVGDELLEKQSTSPCNERLDDDQFLSGLHDCHAVAVDNLHHWGDFL